LTASRAEESADRYGAATDLLVELCKGNFGQRLTSIVLYGSAALKDCIPDFSDLDVMLVIEDHLRGPEDQDQLESIRKRILEKTGVVLHESWVFGKSLLLSVPALWETLSARTLYGERIIEEAPLLDLGKRTSIKMMHDLRSCWERRSKILGLTERAKTALNYTLKFAQNALLYHDVARFRKAQIVEAFEKKFTKFPTRFAPRAAYENILHWKEIRDNPEALNHIVKRYEMFSESLYWHIGLKTLFEA
jgi:predicted nucleotidyltransferase